MAEKDENIVPENLGNGNYDYFKTILWTMGITLPADHERAIEIVKHYKDCMLTDGIEGAGKGLLAAAAGTTLVNSRMKAKFAVPIAVGAALYGLYKGTVSCSALPISHLQDIRTTIALPVGEGD